LWRVCTHATTCSFFVNQLVELKSGVDELMKQFLIIGVVSRRYVGGISVEVALFVAPPTALL
jgi:hypothetical protein